MASSKEETSHKKNVGTSEDSWDVFLQQVSNDDVLFLDMGFFGTGEQDSNERW